MSAPPTSKSASPICTPNPSVILPLFSIPLLIGLAFLNDEKDSIVLLRSSFSTAEGNDRPQVAG